MTALGLLLTAIGVFVCAAAAAALLGDRRAARGVGAAGAVVGGLLGAAAGVVGLVEASAGHAAELRLPWSLPGAEIALAVDALSAFFVVPVAVVTALAAAYTPAYSREHRFGWASFNILAAAMLVVLTARSAMLFLLAWESMTLASFALVMTRAAEDQQTLRAGWIYLVATHIGTAFLIVMFLLLGRQHGGFAAADAAPGLLFALALAGFGTKAGLMPAHVWLPEAHPAAPSPVSAVMSGVMIKTGIYGILRMIASLGEPSAWWGWTLLAVGVASGLLALMQALAQRDLKRLLAYSSVENIGIICIGIGMGVLGREYSLPEVSVLGFAGALLHVLAHAAAKSLLFLGAGAVDKAAGGRDLEGLGGLLKRMPLTGAAFLAGAAAIAALPPLAGFASELLIALSAFRGVVSGGPVVPALGAAGIGVIASLALIGGLAAACFARAFAIAFLGEPRGERAAGAVEVPASMLVPMLILAAACLALGLGAPLVAAAARAPVALLLWPAAGSGAWPAVVAPLAGAAAVGGALLALLALAAVVRRLAFGRKKVRRDVTWDCGYVAPTARMQYTAASFAQAATDAFRPMLGGRSRLRRPQGVLAEAASLEVAAEDPFLTRLFNPLFTAVAWAASRMRWLQQATIQVYILYIAVTVLVLLVWKLG
jgi:hydrogenase-4 component B